MVVSCVRTLLRSLQPPLYDFFCSPGLSINRSEYFIPSFRNSVGYFYESDVLYGFYERIHNRRSNWVTIKSIYGTLCNYWRAQLVAIGSPQCRHRPLSTVFKLGSWLRMGDSLCCYNKVASS